MHVQVHGKQLSVGNALRQHAEEKLTDLNQKYFNRGIESAVIFSREGTAFFKAHINIHIGKDIWIQSEAVEDDPYLSFDVACGKLAKQMRRYKRRLRDHRDRIEQTPEREITKARNLVLALGAGDDAQDNGDAPDYDQAFENDTATTGAADTNNPLVVAELAMAIETLSVSEAVMRMDLSGQPALLFKNAKHGGLNMIYRRTDGNVGWVDPGTAARASDGNTAAGASVTPLHAAGRKN